MPKKSNVDTILSYILIKKLVRPISSTPAYKLGLVDNSGKIIRKPEIEEEYEALTILDRIIFQIKRLLGHKLMTLNNFLFLQSNNNDFYNNLVIRGTTKQKAEMVKINREFKDLQEKYEMETEDVMNLMIYEEIDREL